MVCFYGFQCNSSAVCESLKRIFCDLQTAWRLVLRENHHCSLDITALGATRCKMCGSPSSGGFLFIHWVYHKKHTHKINNNTTFFFISTKHDTAPGKTADRCACANSWSARSCYSFPRTPRWRHCQFCYTNFTQWFTPKLSHLLIITHFTQDQIFTICLLRFSQRFFIFFFTGALLCGSSNIFFRIVSCHYISYKNLV